MIVVGGVVIKKVATAFATVEADSLVVGGVAAEGVVASVHHLAPLAVALIKAIVVNHIALDQHRRAVTHVDPVIRIIVALVVANRQAGRIAASTNPVSM